MDKHEPKKIKETRLKEVRITVSPCYGLETEHLDCPLSASISSHSSIV
ncbi:hypothetical protein YQE_02260, partial [Dendroctonus ponderosae]